MWPQQQGVEGRTPGAFTQKSHSSKVFSEGAVWEILKPHEDPLYDSCEKMFCDPTMSQDIADLEYEK